MCRVTHQFFWAIKKHCAAPAWTDKRSSDVAASTRETAAASRTTPSPFCTFPNKCSPRAACSATLWDLNVLWEFLWNRRLLLSSGVKRKEETGVCASVTSEELYQQKLSLQVGHPCWTGLGVEVWEVQSTSPGWGLDTQLTTQFHAENTGIREKKKAGPWCVSTIPPSHFWLPPSYVPG